MATAQQALKTLSKPKLPDTPEVKAPGEGATIAPAPSFGIGPEQPKLPEIDEETYNGVRSRGGAPRLDTGGSTATGNAGSLISKAKSFLGTPYKWGGTSPLGFDCSGFVQYIFKQYGINLPRMSYAQASYGQRISLKDLRPGDLVAWDNSSRNNGADHISIYIGDGKVIHAPKPGDHVKISNIFDSGHAWGVRMNF